MLLSVIIPTYKRNETLGACLKQLAPTIQGVSPDSYEIVVTNDALLNASTDVPNPDLPNLRYNQGPQKGPASNRNSGAKASTGKWLVFLDDDCVPQASFISGYLEAIQQHSGYQVFEGRTLAERPKMRMDEEAPINEEGGYLWSCNFMIQRELFFDIGGFCELYPYACMEDVDFREQLKARNVNFLFIPKASVVHPWRSFAPEEKYFKMRMVSHAIFIERYPVYKPSFYKTCHAVTRNWILAVIKEAPSMKFRGFWRYCERMATVTVSLFGIWSQANSKAPRG
jgi:glycosyltransferase involved in cell wall biosynthesis